MEIDDAFSLDLHHDSVCGFAQRNRLDVDRDGRTIAAGGKESTTDLVSILELGNCRAWNPLSAECSAPAPWCGARVDEGFEPILEETMEQSARTEQAYEIGHCNIARGRAIERISPCYDT